MPESALSLTNCVIWSKLLITYVSVSISIKWDDYSVYYPALFGDRGVQYE